MDKKYNVYDNTKTVKLLNSSVVCLPNEYV